MKPDAIGYLANAPKDDEPAVSRPTLDYCYDEDGVVYFARGDFSDDVFISAIREEVDDDDDPILAKQVQHGFMRYTPDPDQEHQVMLAFGVAKKRGAWKATWVSSEG